MKSERRASYATRESILRLLSDEEVARVGTAESAAHLSEGEEYVDLQQIAGGVRKVVGATVPMARIVPRSAVHEDTWKRIVAELLVIPVAPNGASRAR